MDTSTMKYPFGRCFNCGKEFNSELRNEYEITHCPYCGILIDDFLSAQANEHKDDIFCDECGTRIYERCGKGGYWFTHNGEKQPGVCSGPCERELCGNCGEWDDEGCCPKCHAKNPDELCAGCPKENCDELPETCKNPCPTCPGDIKFYTDNTDKRHECEKYREFLKQLPQYEDEDPLYECGRDGILKKIN